MSAYQDLEPLCKIVESVHSQAMKILYGRTTIMTLPMQHRRSGKTGVIVGVKVGSMGISVMIRFLKDGKSSRSSPGFPPNSHYLSNSPESGEEFHLGNFYLMIKERRM